MLGQVLEGAVPKLQRRAFKCDVLSQSPGLAKLNPECNMNYSIIFTEIIFFNYTVLK